MLHPLEKLELRTNISAIKILRCLITSKVKKRKASMCVCVFIGNKMSVIEIQSFQTDHYNLLSSLLKKKRRKGDRFGQ